MGKVYFFQTARGDCPVKDFIEALDEPTQAKTLRYIELLREHGSYLHLPYSRKIAAHLYELRVLGKRSVRIFYTDHGGNYYLVHAIFKKADRLPQKDIRLAIDRRAELI